MVAEVAYLLRRDGGPTVELRFLAELVEGTYEPVSPEPADWVRIAELASRYRDLPLGTVDASMVALAERLKIRQIATLDRTHFSLIQPTHGESFELLP